MAYQEMENQIGIALEKTQEAFERFRANNGDGGENEETVFAVVGGDFNFDNMSPGGLNCSISACISHATLAEHCRTLL